MGGADDLPPPPPAVQEYSCEAGNVPPSKNGLTVGLVVNTPATSKSPQRPDSPELGCEVGLLKGIVSEAKASKKRVAALLGR